MCLRGPYGGYWMYSISLWRTKFAVRAKGLDIQHGSVLKIGISSENSIDGVKETVIGHLSQLNIWEVMKDFSFIRETSRSCNEPMGTVIPWSVVQFWLHDNVTIKSPSGCTGAGIYTPVKYGRLSSRAQVSFTRVRRAKLKVVLTTKFFRSFSARREMPDLPQV